MQLKSKMEMAVVIGDNYSSIHFLPTDNITLEWEKHA